MLFGGFRLSVQLLDELAERQNLAVADAACGALLA